MTEKPTPFAERRKFTSLGEAVAEALLQLGKPLVSNHDIFLLLFRIFEAGGASYVRSERPSKSAFNRVRRLLASEDIIRRDRDYGNHWRVLSVADGPADDIVCAADPYCYISHLSAMQRYGLTDRRPEALLLTKQTPAAEKKLAAESMRETFGDAAADSDVYLEPIYSTHHPGRVRNRPIDTMVTRHYGDWRQVRGTNARLGSIGQTFLDMVESPARCGGMLHILSVWEEHVQTYLDDVIRHIDQAPKQIHKVRAGYILEERLGIFDSRVLAWTKFAQRGGSRLLDPSRPFADKYSEKWMLSLNVG